MSGPRWTKRARPQGISGKALRRRPKTIASCLGSAVKFCNSILMERVPSYVEEHHFCIEDLYAFEVKVRIEVTADRKVPFLS